MNEVDSREEKLDSEAKKCQKLQKTVEEKGAEVKRLQRIVTRKDDISRVKDLRKRDKMYKDLQLENKELRDRLKLLEKLQENRD